MRSALQTIDDSPIPSIPSHSHGIWVGECVALVMVIIVRSSLHHESDGDGDDLYDHSHSLSNWN